MKRYFILLAILAACLVSCEKPNLPDYRTVDFSYEMLDDMTVKFAGLHYGLTDLTWDFGDGTYGSGYSVTHRYAEYGNYEVVFSGLGEDGQRYSAWKRITIYERDPNARRTPYLMSVIVTELRDLREDYYLEVHNLANMLYDAPAVTINSLPYTFSIPANKITNTIIRDNTTYFVWLQSAADGMIYTETMFTLKDIRDSGSPHYITTTTSKGALKLEFGYMDE